MPEPIAVAFVEIRPDTSDFKNETDAQVKSKLGADPLAIPSELKVGGVEQAQRDIERVTRDVSTVDVPVEADLAGFQDQVNDAVRASDQTVIIPGQLQLEGVGELQAATAEADQLKTSLSQAAAVPLGSNVSDLAAELEAARQEAEMMSGAIVGTPTNTTGFVALGGSLSDIGDGAAEATDGITSLSEGAGQAVSQLRYAVDVGDKFVFSQAKVAKATGEVASGLRAQTSGLTSAVGVMRDGERTVLNLGSGVFAQVQAFDALKDAQLGLVQVAPNVSQQIVKQVANEEALTAALNQEALARENLTRVRAAVVHEVGGTFTGGAVDPRIVQAEKELAVARAASNAELQRTAALTPVVTEEQAALAVSEHAVAAAARDEAAANELAIDTGQARAITNERVAASEIAVADTTLASSAAARKAEADEAGLIRLRQRRAAPIGPFRLAGAGLGIGVGVFAAAQALGALADGLKVTGDEATTFQGKMSNLASSLLSFDLVGAFGALTNNTHTYSIEQLKLINQTPALTANLKELGQAQNLAASSSAALAGLAQPPQFLQTALAREQAQGDTSGQLRVLERIRDFYVKAKSTARQIGGDQTEVNALLEAADKGIKSTNDEISQLAESAGGGPGGAKLSSRISAAEASGDLPLLGDLLVRRAKAIEGDITKVEATRGQEDAAAVKLRTLTARIKATRAELDKNITDVVNAAVGDQHGRDEATLLHRAGIGPSVLAGTAEQLQHELARLNKERDELVVRISELKVTGEKLKALKTLLEEANRAIEENAAAIIAEEQRHLAANLTIATQGFATAALEAEAFGTKAEQIRSLQAEALALKAQLPLLKSLGPLAADLYDQTLAQYISINQQIEGIRSGITAETERHATALKKSQDEAHQHLLDAIGVREQRILNLQTRAAANDASGDDIKFQKQLVAFYAEQAHNAKLTLEERRAFHDQYVSAVAELAKLRRDETQAAKDQLREDIAAREDVLQDKLTLAKLNEKSTKDDEAALLKLIAFYKRQAHNNKLSRSERRDFLIKERQAEAELRDLAKKTGEDIDTTRRKQFEFMQTLTGFSTNLVSNLIPGGMTGGLVGGSSLPGATQRPVPTRAAAGQGTTRPVSAGQGNTQIALLRAIRFELRKLNKGDSHPEAHQQRRRGTAAGDYSFDRTQGM